MYYRTFLLTSVLSKNPENTFESLKQITLRDAAVKLHKAWNEVSQHTIEKCWIHLFHCVHEVEDDVPLSVLKGTISFGLQCPT